MLIGECYEVMIGDHEENYIDIIKWIKKNISPCNITEHDDKKGYLIHMPASLLNLFCKEFDIDYDTDIDSKHINKLYDKIRKLQGKK